jgi:hypothetical protein
MPVTGSPKKTPRTRSGPAARASSESGLDRLDHREARLDHRADPLGHREGVTGT